MRKSALVAVVSLCVMMFNSSHAQAASQNIIALENSGSTDVIDYLFGSSVATPGDAIGPQLVAFEPSEEPDPQPEEEAPAEEPESPEPKEVEHTVQPGDSLSKIADAHDTEWTRIYFKNTELDNPDILTIGEKLIIPDEDEELEARDIPVPEPVVYAAPQPRATNVSTAAATPQPTLRPASSAGNTYYDGYCTWYSKSRRPDLPNNLGNAITWASRAAAQGIPTGSTPRVGAIAQQGNHVAYVESVNGDGTVTVSEMNYVAWNVVSTRTAPASSFTYIY